MRFQVLLKKENVPGMSFFPFFETNDIQEAKEFAMRLAFEQFNLVKVMDTKRQELVRDFDAAVYREHRAGDQAKNRPQARKPRMATRPVNSRTITR